jgi:hypothetical protein
VLQNNWNYCCACDQRVEFIWSNHFRMGKASARTGLPLGRLRSTPDSRGVPRHSVSRACSVSCASPCPTPTPSRSAHAWFLAPAARAPSTPTRMQACSAAVAGGYCRWGPLQHVQHEIFFFATSRGTHLQHMFKTVETLATYV